MNLHSIRTHCLAKPGTSEERPFGPDTLVFKVMGKMFALMADDDPLEMNLKCDPGEAIVLRQMYPAVKPGYHMNKRQWNTVTVDGSIPDDELYRMVDTSYNLVVKSLKKADQEVLHSL